MSRSAAQESASDEPTSHHVSPSPLLPKPLLRTSRVAVAAPASAALEPAHATAGLSALRARGLTVETLRPLTAPGTGYLAGSDAERAAELNNLFLRDNIDAIVCLRGGYGVMRILDRLDYDAVRAHPKLVIGYSDITALHLALWTKAQIPGLSGPMVAPDWPHLDPESEALFWALAGGAAPVTIQGPDGQQLVPMQSGTAEGVLLGGNLTLVVSLIGTPYAPNFDGAILFLEEVGEPPYRVDRLLAQLRLAGVLGQLGGLVYGAFTGSDAPRGRPSLAIDEVIEQYASYVSGPVARGLVYGHFLRKSTLPVGVRASLQAGDGHAVLTVLGPVVGSSTRDDDGVTRP